LKYFSGNFLKTKGRQNQLILASRPFDIIILLGLLYLENLHFIMRMIILHYFHKVNSIPIFYLFLQDIQIVPAFLAHYC